MEPAATLAMENLNDGLTLHKQQHKLADNVRDVNRIQQQQQQQNKTKVATRRK
jgi:hypothetical protein